MSSRPPARTNDLKSPLAIAAICAMLLPILAFYGILARYVVNIPYYDDYQGVLEFLEHYVPLPTAAAKWGYILTAQHNEYKTIFANAIIALQYQLSGHPNFIWLSWVGNVFVFGLFYLLWRHFLPDERTLSQRLLFFVPVAYLLFQLQYAETLNWSMPGLQNVPVLIFAFATISCLARETNRSFLLAALFMALTIAASGNGFALFPIGILMLIRRKTLARVGAWIAVTALCAAIYFHHYDFHSSQQVHNGSVLRSAQYLNPIFTLSFMGSALGNYVNRVRYAPMLLGIAVCCVLVLMIKSRYDKRNPAVFYFSSFLVLTAIAVSGIRSKLGVGASLAPRYKVYSDLLLICCYVFLMEASATRPQLRRRYFQVASVSAILFCAVQDRAEFTYLKVRQRDLVEGARLYEDSHHQRGPTEFSGDDNNVLAVKINQTVHQIIDDSEATGLYRFP